jgi:tRNA threonylcarbamoyladenosine biosynthesis protein TsaB
VRSPWGGGRDDRLTPAVTALLAELELAPPQLTGVICGAGPGSFTSLRIAAATAKGLAMGIGCPLYAVPSLLLAVPDADRGDRSVLVVLDALRGERFVQPAVRDAAGRVTASAPVSRVSVETLADWDGALVVLDPASGAAPRAGAVVALTLLDTLGPVSLDAWEPAYGRLAEAQVQWEARHGRALPAT